MFRPSTKFTLQTNKLTDVILENDTTSKDGSGPSFSSTLKHHIVISFSPTPKQRTNFQIDILVRTDKIIYVAPKHKM